MAASLTSNEEAQLLQTIEMFEVITQSQPQDYQSLEILKEAYSKLNKQDAVVATSRRIAEAYVQLGQLSSAILEYESILQRFPEDRDVAKALQAIEDKATNFTPPPAVESIGQEKAGATGKKEKTASGHTSTMAEDGKASMQKLLVDSKLITLTDFDMFWPKPSLNESPRAVQDPFIHILSEKQILPLEKSMKALADKSRAAYMPLEKYDVDVELARSFPRDPCLRWCVLPFDKLSKSVLVATANPFNKQAARELEAHTKNRLLFYLASPIELTKILKKIFR